MRRKFIFVFLSALLSAAYLSAQTSQGVLLPNRLGDCQAISKSFTPNASGDLQVLTESGLLSSESRSYANGAQVDLFRFRDPSGAYAVLTYFTGIPGVAKAGAKSWAPSSAGRTVGIVSPSGAMQTLHLELLQVGDFVGRIYSSEENPTLATKAALSDVLSKQADKTPLPPIRTYLPDANRIGGTERYALGTAAFRAAAVALERADAVALVDVAGFDSGAEAMFARYRTGREEAMLLLIDYPTPQLAELHLRHLERALRGKQSGNSVERKGSLLSIVLGPTSAEYAEKLRGAVNYETAVTWNESSTTATDPPITSTLVKIIVATGVFMMVTIVLGIAFGGVRIVTKRLFPGKVFDRPAQMEVLQLGLSGKPIDPRDMY